MAHNTSGFSCLPCSGDYTYLLIVTSLQIPLLLLKLSDLFPELVGNLDPLCHLHLPTRLFVIEFIKSCFSGIEGKCEVAVLGCECGDRRLLVLDLHKELNGRRKSELVPRDSSAGIMLIRLPAPSPR